MVTLARYALGALLVAHGWVHVVYVASSRGWFGPDGDWQWNGRSWLGSAGGSERRLLAVVSVGFLTAALGFTAGAVGYVFSLGWWVSVVAGAALLSTLGYLALWDGSFENLAEKGALGVGVDLAILGWALAIVGL